MPNIGATELIIILIILVLLFGAKKLPELAKSVGASMRELRNGVSGETQKTNDKTSTDKTSE